MFFRYQTLLLSTVFVLSDCLDLHNEPTYAELLQTVQSMNASLVQMQKELQQLKDNRSVGFYARLHSNDFTLGVHQTIEFNEVLTNVGGGYDSRHGHFTAPVKGMYQFVVTIMCTSNRILYVELVKNGQFEARIWAHCPSDISISTTETSILVLDSGDMVWVRQGTGHTGDIIHGEWCNFSGHLLR